MQTFYSSAIESTITYGLTVWYVGCSTADEKALRFAEKTIGCSLPWKTLQTLDIIRAKKIIKDSSHHGHHHIELMHSVRRKKSIETRTNRLLYSVLPKAIQSLNKHTLISSTCLVLPLLVHNHSATFNMYYKYSYLVSLYLVLCQCCLTCSVFCDVCLFMWLYSMMCFYNQLGSCNFIVSCIQ